MIEFLDSLVHSHPSSYCPLNYVWVYFGACVCVFVCDCGTRICSQCKLFVRGEGEERHSTLLLSMQSSELSHYVPCPTCATCRYSFPLSVLYQLLNLLCILCHVLLFICVVALLFLPWITRPVLVYTLLSYHCLEKEAPNSKPWNTNRHQNSLVPTSTFWWLAVCKYKRRKAWEIWALELTSGRQTDWVAKVWSEAYIKVLYLIWGI